ncbi:AVT6 [Symbiodinium pilosum]|uniref:AVT6 protein n=1 Tax=Symbiodinium pilosum TaxID=2952 RepID=A0A812WLF5_SYMPI|nr:AVT6 [Symbiodinium pilosum]
MGPPCAPASYVRTSLPLGAFTGAVSRPQLHRRAKTGMRRRVWEDAAAFCSDPLVSCVGTAALVSGMTILRVAMMDDDKDTPKEFLKQRRRLRKGTAPIVCLGDSITRGNLSSDWVSSLREELKQGLVLNAGINMQCSSNIQQRIGEVIKCQPSHVTVLVGTNDLKAALSPVEGFMYRVFGQLPEVPSLESYERTLRDIKTRLIDAGANVALVSPPVLGEDIHSEANKRAAEFASVVRKVAQSGGACTYLPLFEMTFASLPVGGRPYCGMNFFAWCCLLCWDMHILQRDPEEIQRERNLGVTLDLVHLGPQAAKRLADMVHDFIRTEPPTISAPQVLSGLRALPMLLIVVNSDREMADAALGLLFIIFTAFIARAELAGADIYQKFVDTWLFSGRAQQNVLAAGSISQACLVVVLWAAAKEISQALEFNHTEASLESIRDWLQEDIADWAPPGELALRRHVVKLIYSEDEDEQATALRVYGNVCEMQMMLGSHHFADAAADMDADPGTRPVLNHIRYGTEEQNAYELADAVNQMGILDTLFWQLCLAFDSLDMDPMCSPQPSPVPSPWQTPIGSEDVKTTLASSFLEKEPESSHAKPPQATLFSSWCVLANTLLGVGILGLPWAIAAVGLALGIFMLLGAGACAALALHLLSSLAMDLVDGRKDAIDITFYSVCIAVAPCARHWVDVTIAIKCFGVATSYLQVIGQLGPSVVGDMMQLLGWDVRSKSEDLRLALIGCVVVFIIGPVVFHKTITKTALKNMVAIFSWLYVSALMAGYAALFRCSHPTWQVSPPADLTFVQFASVLPVFIFSFTCHQNLFPIASELKDRSLERLDRVLICAISTGLVIFAAAGFSGYLTFGQEVHANFLEDLPPNGLILLGKCLVLLAVIFTYPLQLHPCRRSLMILVQSIQGRVLSRSADRICRRIFTVLILVGTVILAVVVHDLGTTLAFVGTIGSNTVVLIMPGFLYMPWFMWVSALLLFLLGCLILPTCLGALIYKLITGAS